MRLLQCIGSIHYLFYWLDLLLLFVFYAIKRVYTQQTFVGLQDVLKTSSTRLQHSNFRSSKTSWRGLEDVFKTSPKTSSRRLGRRKIVNAEDVFKTSWRHILRTSSRCLGGKQNFYWWYLYLTNLNVYLTNLRFTNLYLKNLRRIQNASLRTQ